MSLRARHESREPSPRSRQLIAEAASSIAVGDPRLEGWYADYVRNHRRRLAFDLDLVGATAPPGARILEVGSVPLLLTAALKLAGYDITGVDLAPERFTPAIARLGLRISRCNVETEPLPFPDAGFNVVLFNEIFEHLRIDPVFTLKEVHRICVDGGNLLLSTPNLRSLRGVVNFLLHGRAYSCCGDPFTEYSKLRELGHMGHVREYTTVEVGAFFSAVGFGLGRSSSEEGTSPPPPASSWARFHPCGRSSASWRPRKLRHRRADRGDHERLRRRPSRRAWTSGGKPRWASRAVRPPSLLSASSSGHDLIASGKRRASAATHFGSRPSRRRSPPPCSPLRRSEIPGPTSGRAPSAARRVPSSGSADRSCERNWRPPPPAVA